MFFIRKQYNRRTMMKTAIVNFEHVTAMFKVNNRKTRTRCEIFHTLF